MNKIQHKWPKRNGCIDLHKKSTKIKPEELLQKIGGTSMNNKFERDILISLLLNAGLKKEETDKLMLNLMITAIREHVSIMDAIKQIADPNAHQKSLEYRFYTALKKIGNTELDKLTSLFQKWA